MHAYCPVDADRVNRKPEVGEVGGHRPLANARHALGLGGGGGDSTQAAAPETQRQRGCEDEAGRPALVEVGAAVGT
jgi:hypothetical protein